MDDAHAGGQTAVIVLGHSVGAPDGSRSLVLPDGGRVPFDTVLRMAAERDLDCRVVSCFSQQVGVDRLLDLTDARRLARSGDPAVRRSRRQPVDHRGVSDRGRVTGTRGLQRTCGALGSSHGGSPTKVRRREHPRGGDDARRSRSVARLGVGPSTTVVVGVWGLVLARRGPGGNRDLDDSGPSPDAKPGPLRRGAGHGLW